MKLKTSLTLGAAAIAATATNVSADEQPTVTAPETNIQTQNQTQTVTLAEQETIVSNTENELAQANNQAATAFENLQTAENNYKEAENLLAESKDPLTTEKLQAEIEETNKLIERQELNITETTVKIQKKEAEIKEQSPVTEKATNDVKDQEQVVKSAEQNAKEAKDILAGLGEDKLKAEINNLTKEVAEKQTTVDALTKEVEAARKSDEEKAKAIDETKAALNQAENDKTAKTTNLSKQELELEQAKLAEQAALTKKNQLEARVKELKENQYNKNLLTMSDGYIRTLTEYLEWQDEQLQNGTWSETREEGNRRRKELKNIAINFLYAPENEFKPNKEDDIVVATNATMDDLPLAIREELSHFAAEIINDIRKKLGYEGMLLVNSDAIDMAKDIARKSDGSDNNWWSHDERVITAEAAKRGLNSADNYYENAGFPNANYNEYTLNDLKEKIHFNIKQAFFDDDHVDWGHANSLSGYSNAHKAVNGRHITFPAKPSKYFGLGIGITDNNRFLQTRFIAVREDLIEDKSKFNTSANLTAPDREEKLRTAESELKAATTEHNEKQVARLKEEQDVHNAKSELNKAESAVRDLNNQLQLLNKESNIPALEQQLEKETATLNNRKVALSSKEQQLAVLLSDKPTKEANLKAAEERLAKENATLKQLQEVKTKEVAKLDALVKELDALKVTLREQEENLKLLQGYNKEDQEKLDLLANAETIYKAAKLAYDTAKEEYEASLQTVKELEEKLAQQKELLNKLILEEGLKSLETGEHSAKATITNVVNISKNMTMESVLEESNGNLPNAGTDTNVVNVSAAAGLATLAALATVRSRRKKR
ncbi:SEC10/PgrA surface exclusion domain-containing protein [Streptococcus sp. NLN64]|uniref:SEC10/PgrA surface exclusion domain-containing protein n=1 Tax=Streptococcus sp. NLN64 TaxID=2822799 RepID=UPI0018C9345C|nr:SEC10/PgrA surface exclusion domain-containing protein [Streptococcus sp. NLN64]MBG9366886.1 SEC10/PgrA surface exclusion domain-containing protein [Streptococcus sp. NLN64]